MLELFYKGGPLMYPILLCSVLALAIFFERLYTLNTVHRGALDLLRQVETRLAQHKVHEAIVLCREAGSPISRIFLSALGRFGQPRERIKDTVEEVGGRESAQLERYLGFLATIANISPLLGLLGTVLGMIKAFTVLSVEGVGTPATLGGGISEALITTAAGLSVAIPALLIHKFLSSRVDRILLEMEQYSMHLVDLSEG